MKKNELKIPGEWQRRGWQPKFGTVFDAERSFNIGIIFDEPLYKPQLFFPEELNINFGIKLRVDIELRHKFKRLAVPDFIHRRKDILPGLRIVVPYKLEYSHGSYYEDFIPRESIYDYEEYEIRLAEKLLTE